MTASVGLRHLFCRRQDLCCGLQVKKKKSFKFISCIGEPFVLDSRRQESAAGSTGNVNVQILEAIKSLQEQVADLQAKSTQPAVSSIQQCAVSKKAPKELLVKYIAL